MSIKSQINIPIYKKKSIFHELESQFYNNIEQLKDLDKHDPLYHKLYYENEDILKEVHQYNKG